MLGCDTATAWAGQCASQPGSLLSSLNSLTVSMHRHNGSLTAHVQAGDARRQRIYRIKWFKLNGLKLAAVDFDG